MRKRNFAAGLLTSLTMLGVTPNFNTVAYADSVLSENTKIDNILVYEKEGILEDYRKKSFIDGVMTLSSLGYTGSINNAKGKTRGVDVDIYSWYYNSNYCQIAFLEKKDKTYIITYNLGKEDEVLSLSKIIEMYKIDI